MWQIAVVLSGCVVNGKPYGPGSSSTASNGGGAAPSGATNASSPVGGSGQPANDRSDLYTSDGRVREDARYYKEPPYLSAPADPWAAVQGEYPLRWTEEAANHWTLRGNESPCTAVQDHCLVKDAWFFVKQSDIDRKVDRPAMQISAMVGIFGPTGPKNAWNARPTVNGENLLAYRTVPATKQNLVPGVIGNRRQQGVATTGDKAEKRWLKRLGLEEVGGDVALQVVDGDQR